MKTGTVQGGLSGGRAGQIMGLVKRRSASSRGRLRWFVVFPWEFAVAGIGVFVLGSVLESDQGFAMAGAFGAIIITTFLSRRARETTLRATDVNPDRRQVVGPAWLNAVVAVIMFLGLAGGDLLAGAISFGQPEAQNEPLVLWLGALLLGAGILLFAVVLFIRKRRPRVHF